MPLLTIAQLAALTVAIPVFLVIHLIQVVKGLLNPKTPKDPKTILITGATSGLGEALAIRYAKSGVVLCLTGRNKERLATVSSVCEKAGAKVESTTCDVTDQDGLEKWIESMDDKHSIDMVIANAGVTEDTARARRDIVKATRSLFAINVDGVFNTVLPLVQRMKDRKSGQIVIMSSLAGYGSLPLMTAYAATKSAVRVWGEGLRSLVKRHNVFVTVVCPGFVHTPMLDATGKPEKMPFRWTTQQAIDRMVADISKGVANCSFPAPMHFIAWIGGVAPASVRDFIHAWM